MNSKEMLEHVEPFYEMILSTLILSNNSSLSWKRDSEKLIDFICESYNIEHLSEDYKEMILNTINNLSLVNEYKGLRREHDFNDEYSEIEIAYNMKGQALLQLKKLINFYKIMDSQWKVNLIMMTQQVILLHLDFKQS